MSERPPLPGAAGQPSPIAGTSLPVPPLSWEGIFPSLSHDAQTALLERAAVQGGLSPRDLPSVPGTPLPSAADRRLAQILAAVPDELPAFLPVELTGPHASAAGAHALSAALGCPDLFLIGLEPGPERLSFATDLVLEAARRGERVAVLTATSGEADGVVARLAERADLLVARALGASERPDRLPGASAIRTVREQGEGLVASIRQRVSATRPSLLARQSVLQTALASIEDLRPLAIRSEQLTADEEDLPRRLAGESDTSLAAALRARADGHAGELARIDAEGQKLAGVLAEQSQELARLQADRVRLERRGVLGSILHSLFGRGDGAATTRSELGSRCREIENAIRVGEAEAARIAADRAGADTAHRSECDRLIQEETRCRRAVLADERASVDAEFRCRWAGLSACGIACPATPTADAVERAVAELDRQLSRIEVELTVAADWAEELDAGGPDLVREFLDLVRVVVGPTTAVGTDRLLPAESARFDRLILTSAEHLGEAELISLARTASRWVLLGDAGAAHFSHRPGPVAHRGRRDGRAPARPGYFHKLWRHFHSPSWVCEGERLVARLLRVDRAPSDSLRVEPLADRPEVELRFVDGPDGEPVIAEVAFPADVTLADAKSFLAAELGEFQLAILGPVRWLESDDRLLAEWPLVESVSRSPRTWVELASGVRELVAGTGADGRTAAVAFARDAGWDRDRAIEWLTRHATPGRAVAGPRASAPAPVRQTAGVAV